jgi:hypothetical protein
MTAAVLALCIIFTFFFTIQTLRKYGNPRKSFLTTSIVMTAWFFSFSIVVILPMDVSAVCPPQSLLMLRRFILTVFAHGIASNPRIQPLLLSRCGAPILSMIWQQKETQPQNASRM